MGIIQDLKAVAIRSVDIVICLILKNKTGHQGLLDQNIFTIHPIKHEP